ncbi:maltose O-acetyltransferase, partial [Tremellales sp. Uapishka_1]
MEPIAATPPMPTQTSTLQRQRSFRRKSSNHIYTEFAKMVSSQPYDPLDSSIESKRARAADLQTRINGEADGETRDRLIRDLLGCEADVEVDLTHAELKGNIQFEGKAIVYPTCQFNDSARSKWFLRVTQLDADQPATPPVTIGSHTIIGSSVSLLTTYYPTSPSLRWAATAPSPQARALPIVIGSNVFIGSGSIILCGITVGDGSVVGAGSVVTRNVSERCVVAGNPARLIRRLDGEETEWVERRRGTIGVDDGDPAGEEEEEDASEESGKESWEYERMTGRKRGPRGMAETADEMSDALLLRW